MKDEPPIGDEPLVSLSKMHWKKERTMDLLRRQVAADRKPSLGNFLKFFEVLGEELSGIKTGHMPDHIEQVAGKYIHPEECHINASVVTHVDPSFSFYYGFCDFIATNYNGSLYLGTPIHSFNVHKDGNGERTIFDPTISRLNISDKDEVFHHGRNYMGAMIPREILEDIISSNPGENGGIVNISGFLKRNVFPSEAETGRLIESIRRAS